ncbi:MAG: 3-dehydroquinate synthase [Gemmataceae bacterium]|nr:3-dehydroquinate synthase [Gemmataceae bacterium]
MATVRVSLGNRGYDIAIDEPGGIGPFVAARVPSRRAYMIADYNVAARAERWQDELNEAGITSRLTTIPPGEASKSLAQLGILYERLAQAHVDRQTAIIAVGGGVVGDLAGFAAATHNRGIPLLIAPTTLLAMVDSSVGGKVGINLPEGKNLVGAFHQPAGVWIATDSLATLPDREYRSGLAEVVKYGVGLDGEFFDWLQAHSEDVTAKSPAALARVIARCCTLKARVVEQDEYETTGVRAVLNLGHTFAHAFETVAGYGTWTHGEAVAAGQVCAGRLAARRGLLPEADLQKVIHLLKAWNLPVAPPEPANVDAWLDAMKRDKKSSGGRIRLVLPTRIGSAGLFDDVSEAEIRGVLDGRAQ